MQSDRPSFRPLVLPVLLWLIFATTAASQSAQNAPQCTSVSLEFSLKAGESYQRKVGDLTLQVPAAQNGWSLTLDDAEGHDYIYPVNLPIRFNPWQILGPGYDLSAKESLKMDRELRFLLNNSDYEFVKPLLTGALWPYSAPDPEHATEKYVDALGRLRTGLLQLKIVRAEVSPDDNVRSATFRVDFTAPIEYRFDPSLTPHPAACPKSSKF